jgi:hypothetical protein
VTPDIVNEAQRRQKKAEQIQILQDRLAAREQAAAQAKSFLSAGDYERTLDACPNVDPQFHPDPCEVPYHGAAQQKAAVLLKQSKLEIQEDNLDDAVRDARKAVALDRENESAKDVLTLAQNLQQAVRRQNQ